MQMDLQSTTLERRPLVLPLPGRVSPRRGARPVAEPAVPVSALFLAQRGLARSQFAEAVVWLLLGLSAVAVLLMSFWL